MTSPETKTISPGEGINEYTTFTDNNYVLDLEDVTDASIQDGLKGTYTVTFTIANAENSDVTYSFDLALTVDQIACEDLVFGTGTIDD